MDFNKMTKKEIDEYAESIGINLDRRKNKKTMISELKKAQKAKAKAPKAKAPKSSKKPSKPARSKVEEGFWNKFKNFFN
jgi:hypothetical protein